MAGGNRGPQLAAISATFCGMALFATLLRCYVRARIVKAYGWDDGFMTAAVLIYAWYTACVLGGIHFGTGRHMSTLAPEDSMKALRFWWMCYISYCSAMTLAKVSIGLFFLRVTVARIHHWIIKTVMAVNVVTGLIFFFVVFFQCTPISYFWTRIYPDSKGHCIPIEVIIILTYIYGSFCALCDFTLGLLPIALVWNLSMDRKTKFLIVPILGMACIASAAVLVRMPYIKDFKNPDFLYATVDIAIWSTTEAGLAITAGSLATLRPLYRHVLTHFSSQEYPEGEEPGTIASPQPSSKRRKRPHLFSLSNFTSTNRTNGTNDIDFEFCSAHARPYKLRDEESTVEQAERHDSTGGDKTWGVATKEYDDGESRGTSRSEQTLSRTETPI